MQDITVEELKKRMDNHEELTVIDVREEWEYEEFNIGGKLIPMATLPSQLDELASLKDKEIILHCKSGGRSGRAKILLQQKGFSNVRNLIGGMMKWQETFGG